MRVCTYNVFQAPTMPDRHSRLDGLWRALDYLDHHLIDVLCLQECHSFRAGPFTYALYCLCLRLPAVRACGWLMVLLDYLMVIEGLLLPLFLINNKQHIIDYCKHHTRLKHSVHTANPCYFVDSGLLILSAHAIDARSIEQINLEPDTANRPGLLACNIIINKQHIIPTSTAATQPPSAPAAASSSPSPAHHHLTNRCSSAPAAATVAGNCAGRISISSSSSSSSNSSDCSVVTEQPLIVRVYNLHLLPSLLDVNLAFRALNLLNQLFSRHPATIRSTHLAALRASIERAQCSDAGVVCVIAGDMNCPAGSEQEQIMRRILGSAAAVAAGCTKEVATPDVTVASAAWPLTEQAEQQYAEEAVVQQQQYQHQKQAGECMSVCDMLPARATACEVTFPHEGQVDYILVDQRIRKAHALHTFQQPTAAAAAAAAPSARYACRCERVAGECAARPQHVWPTATPAALHSTRVETMFGADHYPLLADLSFLAHTSHT